MLVAGPLGCRRYSYRSSDDLFVIRSVLSHRATHFLLDSDRQPHICGGACLAEAIHPMYALYSDPDGSVAISTGEA